MVVAEEREERETLLMSEFERMRVSGKNITEPCGDLARMMPIL